MGNVRIYVRQPEDAWGKRITREALLKAATRKSNTALNEYVALLHARRDWDIGCSLVMSRER